MQITPAIKPIIDELIILKQGNVRLSKQNCDRAKELLASLRRMGYNAREISGLTGGDWKESAIRAHIRGVWPDRNSKAQKAKLDKSLKKMMNEDNFIEKPPNNDIVSSGIPTLTLELLPSDTPTSESVLTDGQLKASQTSISNLTGAVNHEEILEGMGIDATTIEKLVEVDKIMQLINPTGGPNDLQRELDGPRSDEVLQKSISSMESNTMSLQVQKDIIKTDSELYKQLEQKGLTQDLFQKFVEGCMKYGEADRILEAINEYTSLSMIKDDINNKKVESKALEEDIQKLKAEMLHEAEIAAMCRQLLRLKFNLSTLQRIYQTAKQYDDPAEVLKAIDKYGKIQAIEEENLQLRHERNEALNRIKELEQRLSDYDELKHQLQVACNNLTEVENKAIMLIRESTLQLEKPAHLRSYPKAIIDSGVADRLDGTFEREFTRQLNILQDSELLQVYENEIEHHLNEIEKLWPTKSLGKITSEKEKILHERAAVNPFVALRRNWGVRCELCGNDWPHNLTLDTYTIQHLLKGNSIEIPNCKLNVGVEGVHTISVSLRDIVKLYLEQYIDNV